MKGTTVTGRWYRDGAPIRVTGERTLISDGDLGSGADENTLWIAPGMTDLQVNGYAGIDYTAADLDVHGIDQVIEALRRSGTTTHYPTIITTSPDRICRNAELIANAALDPTRRNAIGGIHIEGPFISADDGPRGAHDRRFVRLPDVGEAREWIAAGKGLPMIVTLAPELPGATAVIEMLSAEGVIVAVGHTAASRDEIRAAVAAGARLSTHLGNGSSALLPRLDNHIWSQMAEDRLWASFIADGYHVPPDALRVMVRGKAPSRVVLVSDASPVAGLAPGPTRWGAFDVEVHRDGHVSLMGTPYLAGAGHLLDRCVAQAVKHTDLTLGDAIDACTCRIDELRGRPVADSAKRYSKGSERDLIRFRWNPGDETLRVTDVFHNPQITEAGGGTGPVQSGSGNRSLTGA